jgi:hypothetical protein
MNEIKMVIASCILLAICISQVSAQAAPTIFKEQAMDTGEISAGNYGETTNTYSSSSGMSNDNSAYPNTAAQTPYSFSTVPRTTQFQTGTSSAAALTFQAPRYPDQQTLLTYDILANQPDSVFFNQVTQPWQTFASSFPKNMPAFWVKTQTGWQWSATCPLDGWAQEIMFIPHTGTLGAYEIYPDRTTKYYTYGYATPGYHYIWFHGDAPGRHMSIITVDNMPSNAVAIDVV